MSSYIISYTFSSSCVLRGSAILCYDLTNCKICLQMLIVKLIYTYVYEGNKRHLFCRMALLLCPTQESCVNQLSSLFRKARFFQHVWYGAIIIMWLIWNSNESNRTGKKCPSCLCNTHLSLPAEQIHHTLPVFTLWELSPLLRELWLQRHRHRVWFGHCGY